MADTFVVNCYSTLTARLFENRENCSFINVFHALAYIFSVFWSGYCSILIYALKFIRILFSELLSLILSCNRFLVTLFRHLFTCRKFIGIYKFWIAMSLLLFFLQAMTAINQTINRSLLACLTSWNFNQFSIRHFEFLEYTRLYLHPLPHQNFRNFRIIFKCSLILLLKLKYLLVTFFSLIFVQTESSIINTFLAKSWVVGSRFFYFTLFSNSV